MKTFFVYTIQCYEHMDVGTGNLRDVVTIQLIDEDPFKGDELLKKAQKMIQKVGYRVAQISEFNATVTQNHDHSH